MSIRARAAFAILAAMLIAALPGSGTSVAQVPASDALYSGYATGTILHSNKLDGPTSRVTNLDVGFSGASVNAGGLASAIKNEIGRVVQPALSDKQSYARGSAVQAQAGDPANQGVGEVAEASAPPSSSARVPSTDPVAASPALFASGLRGDADARWLLDGTKNLCVLGEDIAAGKGRAALLQVGSLADDTNTEEFDDPVLQLGAPSRARGTSDSLSHVVLVPQTSADGTVEGGNLGVMGEARMTIAPVTILAGTDFQTTIEFGGEWVLQAVATGISGYVHYGPGSVNRESPILRVLDKAGSVLGSVNLQTITGEEGLDLAKTLGIDSIAELVIGEAPRVGSATATDVAAAVDVARIKIKDPGGLGFSPAEIRVGHMEVAARAPEKGIICDSNIRVTKDADPRKVTPGKSFTYTIGVGNPNACDLHDVRLEDTMDLRSDEGKPVPTFEVTGSTPAADASGSIEGRKGSSGEPIQAYGLTWNDVGPIAAGATVDRRAAVSVGSIDVVAPAHFTDEAIAEGKCTLRSAQGTPVDVTLLGSVVLYEPKVCEGADQTCVLGARIPRPLPRTGIADYGTLGLALLGGAGGIGALGARLTRRRLRG